MAIQPWYEIQWHKVQKLIPSLYSKSNIHPPFYHTYNIHYGLHIQSDHLQNKIYHNMNQVFQFLGLLLLCLSINILLWIAIDLCGAL